MATDLNRLLDALADEIAERVMARLPDNAGAADTGQSEWRLLTVVEVAERLHRSGHWIRQRARDGSLPYIRLDRGSYVFDIDDVRDFCRARRVPE